jgi:diacylglycerol kinase (ATP)
MPANSVREFTFVVNPAAGRGSTLNAIVAIRQLLPSFGHKVLVTRTEGPGHATEIARCASTEFVVAVGGDGTINEVVNGLVGTDKALGIIPTGSGNDFIKSVRIPKDFRRALQLLHEGSERPVDAGTVSCGKARDGSTEYAPARYFLNGVGIGFDGQVAWRMSQNRMFRGTMAYFVAVLQTLKSYRSPEFHMQIDGQPQAGRKLLVAAGNGACAGGGFYLTPEAKVDDGRLDLCMIEDIRIPRILPLIPAVMSGKPVKRSFVRYARASTICVESAETFWVHADGEVVGPGVEGVKLAVVPGAVRLLAPDTSNVK